MGAVLVDPLFDLFLHLAVINSRIPRFRNGSDEKQVRAVSKGLTCLAMLPLLGLCQWRSLVPSNEGSKTGAPMKIATCY